MNNFGMFGTPGFKNAATPVLKQGPKQTANDASDKWWAVGAPSQGGGQVATARTCTAPCIS